MSITAIVEALVGAGATPEMILAAVRAAEADVMAREEARKAGQRDRTRKHRERNAMSRDVTLQTVTPPCPPSLSPEPPNSPPYNPPIIPSPVGDGAVPAQDARQILFDEGLALLVGRRIPEKHARSLIGQWLRDSSDDAARVLNAIRLSRDKADPVAWIQAGFQTIRTKREKRRDTAAELRDALADPLREVHDCEPVPHQPVRLVGFGG